MHQKPASAYVKIVTQNNATFQDAYQFDPPANGVTGATGATGPQWNMIGQHFQLDIKRSAEDDVALLSLSSLVGEIVVDSDTQRILHFNVPDTTLRAALVPGRYVYDFIMYDGQDPPIRTPLMHGEFILTNGITGD